VQLLLGVLHSTVRIGLVAAVEEEDFLLMNLEYTTEVAMSEDVESQKNLFLQVLSCLV
jgi:hypothetical protein